MIRRATQKDMRYVLDIYNDAIVNTTYIYTDKPETLDQREKWFSERNRKGFPVIVYEKDNKVVGFASYGQFRSYEGYKNTVEHSVYVHRDYRNQGIGSKLLREIISLAAKSGLKTMVGVIDSSNFDSIKLHEKAGFTHVGTIRKAGFKFNKWLDVVFYQLMLDKQ